MIRDDDMTVSSHVRDAVGRGHGIFSNSHGDVLMCFLQHRHTANTQHNNDNFHYNHDHNNAAAKKTK